MKKILPLKSIEIIFLLSIGSATLFYALLKNTPGIKNYMLNVLGGVVAAIVFQIMTKTSDKKGWKSRLSVFAIVLFIIGIMSLALLSLI